MPERRDRAQTHARILASGLRGQLGGLAHIRQLRLTSPAESTSVDLIGRRRREREPRLGHGSRAARRPDHRGPLSTTYERSSPSRLRCSAMPASGRIPSLGRPPGDLFEFGVEPVLARRAAFPESGVDRSRRLPQRRRSRFVGSGSFQARPRTLRVTLTSPTATTAAPTMVTDQKRSPSPSADASAPPPTTKRTGRAQQSANATSATGPGGNLASAIG